MLEAVGVIAHNVDIENELELQLRYGLRIPVLQATNGAAVTELDWPFDEPGLRAWLAAVGGN